MLWHLGWDEGNNGASHCIRTFQYIWFRSLVPPEITLLRSILSPKSILSFGMFSSWPRTMLLYPADDTDPLRATWVDIHRTIYMCSAWCVRENVSAITDQTRSIHLTIKRKGWILLAVATLRGARPALIDIARSNGLPCYRHSIECTNSSLESPSLSRSGSSRKMRFTWRLPDFRLIDCFILNIVESKTILARTSH